MHNSTNQAIQDSGSTIIGENDSSTISTEYKMIHEIDGTKISNGENSKKHLQVQELYWLRKQ